MSILKAEEVMKGVIADARVADHLRASELQRNDMGFRRHCARFGIQDIGELDERQLFALVAARNVAPAIDLLRIPRGKEIAGDGNSLRYDIRREKTSLGPSINAFLGPVPQDEKEWETLRDPEDIPGAVPEDLLLRRLAPKEFLRRLAEGELLREAWVQDERQADEHATSPSESEHGGASVPEPEDQDILPFGYLLLDASESMGTNRDRRNEVARGIALAFLISQYEAGNPTFVNLFRHELSPTYGGSGRSALESAVAAILGHTAEGMTYLQGSLRLLSSSMLKRTARVDIALITDGISRLAENPLEGAHLHTFLLGVNPKEFDKVAAAQYAEASYTLQTWSDFFLRFDSETMLKVSIPTRQDTIDSAVSLYGLELDMQGAVTSEKVQRLQQRMRNIRSLFIRYREEHGVDDPEIERLWNEVDALVATLGKADATGIARTNIAKWSPIDRDLNRALESREMKGMLKSEKFEITARQVRGGIWVTLAEALERLLHALRRAVGGVLRFLRVRT